MNTDEFDSLFIDRETLAREIAATAISTLRIDSRECRPILLQTQKEMTNPERILVELAAVYLCFVAGKHPTGYLGRDQLISRTGIKSSVLRARLSDMRSEGLIQSTEDGERIDIHGLLRFRDFLTTMKPTSEDGK